MRISLIQLREKNNGKDLGANTGEVTKISSEIVSHVCMLKEK